MVEVQTDAAKKAKALRQEANRVTKVASKKSKFLAKDIHSDEQTLDEFAEIEVNSYR